MYTIKLLEDSKFNKLPYKHTEESLGLADYRNRKAYVRKSGIPALDVLVMGHELQELISKVSPHEEDGIRYKKGGAARTIVPLALGAILAPFTAGTSLWWVPAVAGALSGAGMGAYAGGRHAELGGTGMGALMGGATGLLSGYGAGQLTSGAMAGWGSAASRGASLMGKLGSAAQGALLGTGTAATSMGNVPVAFQGAGLLGPGTIGGSLAGGTMLGSAGKAAAAMLGTNAISSFLNPNSQNKQPTYDNYVPQQYQGFNSATPVTGSVQTIKSTPSPITGWSSAEQKSNLVDKNLSNFDMLIPGRNRQGNIYTWA